jgi:hypothetical protein
VNGDLAQSVAIVAHGNAFLAGLEPQPPRLEETSAFRFVRSLGFDGRTAVDWFAWLREDGVTRLSLVVPPSDPMLSAFADGLPSAVATGRQDWVGKHTVEDLNAPDKRIWAVAYSPHEPWHGEATGRDLRTALDEAAAYADATDELTGWGDRIRDAARLLDTDPPPTDVLPERGFGCDARRALAAADKAWVFGGMGSWNDAGIPNGPRRDEYDRVTRRFFDAAVGAIVSATNSFEA